MATMKRPEIDGTPVRIGDLLALDGETFQVELCCEGGCVYCTDGMVRPVEGMSFVEEGSADYLYAQILTGGVSLRDAVERLQSWIVSDWQAGVAYTAGSQVAFGEGLYTCIQAHTSQADWTPDKTPALWKPGRAPDEVPEWVQPTGAHDAYDKGDRVRHAGAVWLSLVDANVWEPTDAASSLWEKVG